MRRCFWHCMSISPRTPCPRTPIPWPVGRAFGTPSTSAATLRGAFDPKRFAFLRNLISDEGGVEWIDRQYIPGSKDEGIKGKCCKWKASDDMMDLMAEYSAGTGGSCNSTTNTRSSIHFRSTSEPYEVIRPERVMANLQCLLLQWEMEALERVMRPPNKKKAA